MSYRSAQYAPRKNLLVSIFIFSLLLFIYQSQSVRRSVGRQGSPDISPAALLLHFNRRQRPQLYSLVGFKEVSSKNQRQLFLFSFRIIFISLFFRALQLQWQQASPITLYYRFTFLILASSYTTFSNYSRQVYLLGRAFKQYSSRQLLIVFQISSSVASSISASLLVIS